MRQIAVRLCARGDGDDPIDADILNSDRIRAEAAKLQRDVAAADFEDDDDSEDDAPPPGADEVSKDNIELCQAREAELISSAVNQGVQLDDSNLEREIEAQLQANPEFQPEDAAMEAALNSSEARVAA
jgi:hypothetical protein